ncbi:MAG: tetratricopeptide repeat protein [Myxococcota bacterium]
MAPSDRLAAGARLIRQGRPADALDTLRPALAADRADVWYTAAVAWAALGDDARAEDALRRAVALAPGWADAWCELGRALAARGVRDEPEGCFRRAIAASPTHLDARVRLATALTGAGRLDEAGEHLAAGLRTAPNHPAVVAAAVHLLERRGHLTDAWALAASAPEPEPRVAVAAASVGRAVGQADAALRRVDRALPHASPSERTLLLHARGDLLDALDRPDEAFAAWTVANEGRGLIFDPAQHLAAVDSLIARTRSLRWPSAALADSDRPVLIVGSRAPGPPCWSRPCPATPGSAPPAS